MVVLHIDGAPYALVRVTNVGPAPLDTSPSRIAFFCPVAKANSLPPSVPVRGGKTTRNGLRVSLEPVTVAAMAAVVGARIDESRNKATRDLKGGNPKSFHADRLFQGAMALSGWTRRKGAVTYKIGPFT